MYLLTPHLGLALVSLACTSGKTTAITPRTKQMKVMDERPHMGQEVGKGCHHTPTLGDMDCKQVMAGILY